MIPFNTNRTKEAHPVSEFFGFMLGLFLLGVIFYGAIYAIGKAIQCLAN